MKTYPQTNISDLLSLITRLIGAKLRRADLGQTIVNWLTGLTNRYQSPNIVINLLFRKVLLVSDSDLSNHILKDPPNSERYIEGTLKRKAMSFLAPNALTISHDEQWEGLRSYNEKVLCPHHSHPYQQEFLDQVYNAFVSPVTNIDDIRNCMGKVMLGVVFGEKAPAQLIEDIQILFGQVSLKTALFGGGDKKRRKDFYSQLQRIWSEQAEETAPTFLHTAHSTVQEMKEYNFSEEVLVQQIPHWMFTFTNSGSDLLARTLALVTARAKVREKIQQEIDAAGLIDKAETIEKLDYLEACLLETCRLYPPVVQTAHQAPKGDTFKGVYIPPKSEILHFFPMNYRDTAKDARANDFYPDRWLDPMQNAEQAYPNLFLSGARACPGRKVILFICKAAIAILLKKHNIADSKVLASDPLPFSFPKQSVLFASK